MKILFQIIIVVLIVKFMVTRMQKPIEESGQALICIIVGTIIGIVIDFSFEGFITGVIASGIAFYEKDLINEFKNIKNQFKEEFSSKK